MEKIGAERRKFKRVDIKLKAEYSVMNFIPQALIRNPQNDAQPAVTANISEGGVQLLVETAPEPGQTVRLSFGKEGEKVIRAFAKVKWAGYDAGINKYRLGLEFFFLKEPDRKNIQAMVN